MSLLNRFTIFLRTPYSSVLAFFLYIAASCTFFARPGVFTGSSFIGGGSDPTGFIWLLSWWPYAISHGINPFITHFIWAPSGFNLTWANSIPSLAILAWPITAIWGPVVSFNIVTLLAPALAALATFLLCREITQKFLPSLIGGWLFGFSSYELGQLLGHINLDFVVCIPLMLWITVLRFKRKIRFRSFIIISGVTLTFQLGVNTEVLATMSFFMALAVLIAYMACREDRSRILKITKELIWAYVICIIFASPFLYFFILGHGSAPSLIQPFGVYVADLLNYIIPTPITAIGGRWVTYISGYFTGNYSEDGAFLGVFVLTMVGLSAWTLKGNRWVRVLLGMFAVLVIFSFGPKLHVMGRGVIDLPWLIVQHLPLIKQALPVRLTLYISLVIALLVALWLASLGADRAVYGYALAGLAIGSLLPSVYSSDMWLTKLHTPAFFQSDDYRETLKPAENIVILPYGWNGDSMLWQALSDMYFRMAGGYVGFTPTLFTRWPAVQRFYSGPISGYGIQLSAFCAAHGVTKVIVAPGAKKAWLKFFRKLNWQQEKVGGVVIYSVPPEVSRRYRKATSTEMRTMSLLAQFGELKKAGACYLKKGGSLATLMPLKAEKVGCLSSAYGGFPAAAPNSNWTTDGGWLGRWGKNLGVGVVVNDEQQAKTIIERYGHSAREIYFPYPSVWKVSHPPSANTSGQVLLVYRKPNSAR